MSLSLMLLDVCFFKVFKGCFGDDLCQHTYDPKYSDR